MFTFFTIVWSQFNQNVHLLKHKSATHWMQCINIIPVEIQLTLPCTNSRKLSLIDKRVGIYNLPTCIECIPLQDTLYLTRLNCSLALLDSSTTFLYGIVFPVHMFQVVWFINVNVNKYSQVMLFKIILTYRTWMV